MTGEKGSPEFEADPDLPAVFGFDGDGWLGLMRQAAAGADLGSVGGYRLLEEVSRGAQGIVFRAQQEGSGRVVALKRLAAGALAGAEAKERFRREIQAEAILRHPNIVGFEGVELVQGQPLLVMEWIEGVPADRWAREAQAGAGRDRARPVREVLAVFVKICEAVSYAHQRGVIHRDLKPGNILIDAAGEPHVLDFGLARLRREGVGPEASRLTRTEGFVGTPAYAAPEQLEPGPREPDVRGDVYSLGVVLYEMLTGRRPLGDGADWEALLRAVRQESPPSPSRHEKRVDGEVDAIVLRALAKEPARRYQSVHELGADVRRYLAGEAVEARRDSAWYVLSKALRRHRATVAIAAAFALLLLGATAVSGGLWRRAERGFTQARDQAAKAQEISTFIQSILASLTPELAQGRDIDLMRDLLDQASQRLETELAGQPAVQAELHETIGRAYQGLVLPERAEDHLRAALRIYRALHAGDHPDVAAAMMALGRLLAGRTMDPESEGHRLVRASLEMHRRLFGEEHLAFVRALRAYALTHDLFLSLDEAIAIDNRTFPVLVRDLGTDHPEVILAMVNIAEGHRYQGDLAAAEDWLRRALALRIKVHGPDHPRTISDRSELAGLLAERGNLAEAGALARESLAAARRVLPWGSDVLAFALMSAGGVMVKEGNAVQAEPLLRESFRMYEWYRGDDHARTAMAGRPLGMCLSRLGRFQEAEPLLLRAYQVMRDTPAVKATKDPRFRERNVRQSAGPLVDLYEAWEAAEPGKGYAEKAREFRSELEAVGGP